MFFVEDQEILRAQKLRQKSRRSGVKARLGPGIHRLYGGAVVVQQAVRIGKGPQHALCSLTSAPRVLAAKVVQPATGMGVDQGQRALFLLQGPHEGDQQAVLYDIGAVASMEGMAIIHFRCPYRVGRQPSKAFCARPQARVRDRHQRRRHKPPGRMGMFDQTGSRMRLALPRSARPPDLSRTCI